MTPDYEEYDELTLGIVCPVCCAAKTGKCHVPKPTGGKDYAPRPHRERVELAHGLVKVEELAQEGDP